MALGTTTRKIFDTQKKTTKSIWLQFQCSKKRQRHITIAYNRNVFECLLVHVILMWYILKNWRKAAKIAVKPNEKETLEVKENSSEKKLSNELNVAALSLSFMAHRMQCKQKKRNSINWHLFKDTTTLISDSIARRESQAHQFYHSTITKSTKSNTATKPNNIRQQLYYSAKEKRITKNSNKNDAKLTFCWLKNK